MHADVPALDFEKLLKAKPLPASSGLRSLMWLAVTVGMVTFGQGILSSEPGHAWFCFYWSLLFFMGLAAGGVMISAIFQITRATWSVPVRRLTEANVAFLPVAWVLFFTSYFGKEYLFPWARAPRPGTEWWMQPSFVYVRIGLLLGGLFYFMWRFVRLSLRGDLGVLRDSEIADFSQWDAPIHRSIVERWRGGALEIPMIQNRMSQRAPALVITYALVYSFFAFEMIVAMDPAWMSNLFGGFMFMGNVYVAWAVLIISTLYHIKRDPVFNETVTTNQMWDMGKLTFGFCMVWGYFFFSQFLPQWYGNLPEETQYLILRTREFPWKGLSWIVLSSCFIVPFICLLSRDLKKTPQCVSIIALLIFLGVALEKYVIVMPNLSPSRIPFSLTEVGVFVGFLGAYVLSIQSFLKSMPFLVISSPLAEGRTDW